MGINNVYILTEEELKQLLQDQRSFCSDNYVNGLDVISAKEPELPKKLTEWGTLHKIFSQKN